MATLTLDPRGDDAASRHIDITSGTPEQLWQDCQRLGTLPAVELCELVPLRSRAIILAPHPDDETLGCGGLISQLAALGRQIGVIAISDGEGSHPPSSPLKAGLAQLRAGESSAALGCLGTCQVGSEHISLERIGLPDGAVSAHQDELMRWLRAYLKPTDILFAPWRLDGHPDHEAVAQAACVMEEELGCKLIEVPIWTWHWASPDDPRLPWGRARSLPLTPAAENNKRQAMKCYRSQIASDQGRAPVLPANVLAHFVRPYEVFFV